jgi:DNA-binding MarR family transcriptional regulator
VVLIRVGRDGFCYVEGGEEGEGSRSRRRDDADRRRTIVSLPDDMRGALEQFAKARLEPLRRTLEKLDPETREHFIEGLRVLSAEAQAPPQ